MEKEVVNLTHPVEHYDPTPILILIFKKTLHILA